MTHRLPRYVRTLTFIAGPLGNDALVLYTAFGGPLGEREPFDPSIAGNAVALASSREFWGHHALSIAETPEDPPGSDD
jgi:hypothetical protein